MAIQKTIQHTPDGFETPSVLNNAYIRVEGLHGDKNRISINVVFYKKQDDIMVQALAKFYSFSPLMDGGNFIKQGYIHLKTLPEFAGATDC
jgi:hypothetical protein